MAKKRKVSYTEKLLSIPKAKIKHMGHGEILCIVGCSPDSLYSMLSKHRIEYKRKFTLPFKGYDKEYVVSAYNHRNKTNFTPLQLLDELYNGRMISPKIIGMEHLFVSQYVVYRFLEELGIKLREKGHPPNRTGYQKKLLAIPKSKLKNMRPKQIRKIVGCSAPYMCQLLAKYKIDYKKGRGAEKKNRTIIPNRLPSSGIGELIDSRC